MTFSSFKPEVQTSSDPKWYDNALRFATRKEAENSALALSLRWFAVTGTRATKSNDPVNYRHVEGRDVRIEPEPVTPCEDGLDEMVDLGPYS
jgi:hypothetical protein